MNETIQDNLIVASCTLAELLECESNEIPNTQIKGKLTIPEYQRPYVWTEKQINRLLDDWQEYTNKDENKPFYYLGGIILHKDDENHLNIIDGQQRITTVLLIQIINGKKVNNITFSNPKSIVQIKDNLSYLKAIKNRDIFEYSEHDILDSFDIKQINVTLVITQNNEKIFNDIIDKMNKR